jgi:hypothetical protein
MPVRGLIPRVHIALAAEPNVLRSVARQALIASRAQFEPLARVLATALAQRFVTSVHRLEILQQNCGAAQFPERPLFMSVSSN